MRTFLSVYGVDLRMIIDDEPFDYHQFTSTALRVGSVLIGFFIFVGVISNV